MYKMIKEEKDSSGPWEKFMAYVRDENITVIVVLAGKDHIKIELDLTAPDHIKEVPIQ